ncbi:DUF2937 family protein [Pseudoalteromonas sp. SSDWG2]|uniref:DUF2937 family protein n=1 Tax=Pseudoalteromonas sp. SSDWG2 TaxID=3139391 RepID=UPI003BAABE10
MMFNFVRWCRNYLRLSVFFIAALVGLQVPGFKDDYGHALRSGAHEISSAMQPFVDDANRFFSGSLQQLLAHYKKSDDPVYAKGGDNLESLIAHEQFLMQALKDFEEHPYLHLLTAPVVNIGEQVWRNYTPQIQLSTEALASSLVFALLVSWTVEASFLLVLLLITRLFRRFVPRRTSDNTSA